MILSDGSVQRRRITAAIVKEFSGVDRPAMEPALVAIMKRAPAKKGLPDPEDDEDEEEYVGRFMRSKTVKKALVKREDRLAAAVQTYRQSERLQKYGEGVPVMTSETDGHVHLVWLYGSRAGETSYATSSDAEQSHGHAWMIGDGGMLVIGANEDHTHTVDQSSLLAAMREIVIDRSNAPEVALDVVFASADGAAISIEKIPDGQCLEALGTGALIMKNAEGETLDDAALPDGSLPIRCKADLATAIGQVGADGDQHQVAAHVVKRARVLGLESELPENGLFAEVAKAGPAGVSIPKESIMTTTPDAAAGGGNLQKQLDDLRKENEKLTKSLATAAAVAALPEVERTHYSALSTEEAKAAYLSKSKEDRHREIEEIQKGDPVLYKALDGAEFRKSDGDRMVRLAKQADDTARRLAASEAQRSQDTLAKRAETELSSMPGEIGVRTALLKAVDGIEDETARKGALEILKAGNTALSKSGQRIGTSLNPTVGGSASQELDTLAKSYVEKNPGTDFYTAYEKVAMSRPDLARLAVDEQPAAARS